MERILATDIGGGTQDIFLYEPGKTIENCIQLILPSQTVVVAGKIREAAKRKKPVFLHGKLMGGGASVKAVKDHLHQGLGVYATAQAAKTIADDLQKVREMGVEITEGQPDGAVAVEFGDLDLTTLANVLAPYGIKLPDTVAVAVQDHGESIGFSNRLFRFKLWKEFCEAGGDIRNLLYGNVPPYLTRMHAVVEGLPAAYVMDTGSAAIWGSLCDPEVRKNQQDGLIIVNIGNQHTIGVLLQSYRIWGLFEHHTGLLDENKLVKYLHDLHAGKLTNAEIYNDGGHGCYIHPGYKSWASTFTAVTGPRRKMVRNCPYYMAAPFGDMMLTGSFGLVAAIAHTKYDLTPYEG